MRCTSPIIALMICATVPAVPAFAQTNPSTRAVAFDVKAFGAIGDGKTLDTPAINRAIDAAAAAGSMATIRFPPGDYLSVSIHLKSNVTLELERGANIVAASADDGGDFDAPEIDERFRGYQDFGHSQWHCSLIWGEDLENVAIVGPGSIWGKGLVRGHKHPGDRADKAIALRFCKNVTLRDFTIWHGGHMAILASGVENLAFDDLTIDTNRDGIDIDCCKGVKILNCKVNAPLDDAICLKSSLALGQPRDTADVTISGCTVSGYDEGSLLDGTKKRGVGWEYSKGPTGRIKLGTESNGGFKNVTISNCTFDYSAGLAIESVDGAVVEDIVVKDITMNDIANAPIFLRLGARLRGPPESTRVGAMRRVDISNVTVRDAHARSGSIISGIPGAMIEDLKLSHISVECAGGGTTQEATTQPAELEAGYPEPGFFGQIPSYAFFIRHAKGVALDHIVVKHSQQDHRAAFALEDVVGISFDQITAQRSPNAPVLLLRQVKDLALRGCAGLQDVRRPSIEREQF